MDMIKTGLELLISAAISVLVLLHPPSSADTSSALGREGGMDHHGIIDSFGLEWALEIIHLQWAGMPWICWMGRWMCSLREELPALELNAGHPSSLQVTLKDGPAGVCPRGGLLTHVIAPGMFLRTGALPAFLPGLLSAD